MRTAGVYKPDNLFVGKSEMIYEEEEEEEANEDRKIAVEHKIRARRVNRSFIVIHSYIPFPWLEKERKNK